jgi:hypothetical protein
MKNRFFPLNPLRIDFQKYLTPSPPASLVKGMYMPVLAFLPEFIVKDKVKRSSLPKVSEEDVKTIRELYKAGLSYRQLGYKYEISHEMVRRICTKYCYKEVI